MPGIDRQRYARYDDTELISCQRGARRAKTCFFLCLNLSFPQKASWSTLVLWVALGLFRLYNPALVRSTGL